ncbi:hypothetical protein [Saccharothrix yanglingensis]|uniref:hypothetical protein n=1 Tax=Saccharothrix yanglingensis TaxID=659496 RepID=UPI0027D30A63|nr:hypothetical protein [Saccharothrix yanglingensis]
MVSDSVLVSEPVTGIDLAFTASGKPSYSLNVVAPYQDPAGGLRASVVLDGRVRTLRRDTTSGYWVLGPPAAGDAWIGAVVLQLPGGRLWTVAQGASTTAFFRHDGDGFVKVHEEKVGLVDPVVIYPPAAGPRSPSLFGVDPHGNLVRYEHAGGDKWKRSGYDFGGKLKNRRYVVVPFDARSLEVGYCDGADLVRVGVEGDKKHSTDKTRLPEADAVAWGGFVDCASNTGYLCTTPKTRRLYQFVGGRWADLGITAYAVTTTMDGAGLLRAYVDSSDLSLLRQTGWDADGPVWTAGADGAPVAVPLGKSNRTLFPDPLHQGASVFFALEPSNFLVLLGQDPDTGQWRRETVRLADTYSARTRRWRTRVTVRDAAGTPVANHPVRVRTTSTAEVTIGSRTARLGPRRDEVLIARTDRFGALTASTRAHSLTPPAILVTGDGLPEGAQIHPEHGIRDYLSGLAPLADRGLLTAEALRAAKVDGTPLVPSTTWSASLTPQLAVAHLRDLMALGNPSMPRPTSSWVLETGAGGEVSLRRVDTVPESFLGDLGRRFGDVVSGLLAGVTDVARLTLNAADGTVSLGLRIAGKVVDLGRFAVVTASDAVDLFLSAMRALGALTARVIDWLVHRFPFADIWATAHAVEGVLDRTPTEVVAQLQRVRAVALQRMTDFARTDLAGQFDRLIGKVRGSTVGDVKGSGHDPVPPVVGSGGERVGAVTDTLDLRTSVPAHFLFDRVQGAEGELGARLLAEVPDGTGDLRKAVDSAIAAVTGQLSRFHDAGRAFADAVAGELDGTGGSLEQVTLTALLTALRELALTLVEIAKALIDALIDVLVKLGGIAAGLLAAKVDIAPVRDVVTWIADEAGVPVEQRGPVTLKTLVGLLVAFPAVVARHALGGTPDQAQPDRPEATASPVTGKALDLAATVVATALEFGSDLLPPPTTPVDKAVTSTISALLLGNTALSLGLAWPFTASPTDAPGDVPTDAPDDTAAGLAIAKWSVEGLSWLVDALTMYASSKRGNVLLVAKLEDVYGVWLDTAAGLGSLALGVAECAARPSASCARWVNSAVAPVPVVLAFLRSPLFREEMLAVKVGASYAAGVATVVTRVLVDD